MFEVDECRVIEREMFEGDEDEVIKFLLEGDWIVVEGDDWEENGMVVDIDDEEINMFDGKEGWTVKRDEIKKIYFR